MSTEILVTTCSSLHTLLRGSVSAIEKFLNYPWSLTTMNKFRTKFNQDMREINNQDMREIPHINTL